MTLPRPPEAASRPERMVVWFLGTSSGQPTLQRGLSSVALERDGSLFLFDCGEATQIQFRRAGLRFGRLDAIFITHMHGDHVTGLPGMLMSLQLTGRTRPLPIVGPGPLEEFVRTTSRLMQTGYTFDLVFTPVTEAGLVLEADDWQVTTAPLEHRIPAVGYRFQERNAPGLFDAAEADRLGVPRGPACGRLLRGEAVDLPDGSVVRPEQIVGPPRRGRSIAYCTDTRPCTGAVALATQVDLLIHEATFASDRFDDAIKTGHSTAAEAASIAAQAQPRRLIITHFSPRYRDPSILVNEARQAFGATDAALELIEFPV